MTKPNILLLPDNLNHWAIHNKALAIQKFLPEFNFEIRGGFREQGCLGGQECFHLIHFLFTAGLTEYFNFIMKNKQRVVITIVNERSLFHGHYADPQLLDRIFKECPYVNSLTPKIADMYKIPYIPNGIDEDKFNKFKKPIVGFAGASHIKTKNVELLQQVCSQLGLELRLAEYQPGPQGGRILHEDMQDFYMGLDVYVHPSTTEGFNNTIIEALSCNIPVLMTREGAWQDFEGYVEFIEPTEDDIKNKLNRLLGRKLIIDRFTWPKIVPQYKSVYEKALNQGGWKNGN